MYYASTRGRFIENQQLKQKKYDHLEENNKEINVYIKRKKESLYTCT